MRIELKGIQPVHRKETNGGGKFGGCVQKGEGRGRKAQELHIDRRWMGEESLGVAHKEEMDGGRKLGDVTSITLARI